VAVLAQAASTGTAVTTSGRGGVVRVIPLLCASTTWDSGSRTRTTGRPGGKNRVAILWAASDSDRQVEQAWLLRGGTLQRQGKLGQLPATLDAAELALGWTPQSQSVTRSAPGTRRPGCLAAAASVR
jgi:hypothetical protein